MPKLHFGAHLSPATLIAAFVPHPRPLPKNSPQDTPKFRRSQIEFGNEKENCSGCYRHGFFPPRNPASIWVVFAKARVFITPVFSILNFRRKEPDLAVDFGTASLRVGLANERYYSEEPSRDGPRVALRQGVITDIDAAAAVLERVFARYRKSKRGDLHILACAPSDASEPEQAALLQAMQAAGATRTALVPEPVAALVGAGVDIGSSGAFLVIDLGEGVVDCALIKDRRLFASTTWRGGCAALRETVAACVRETLGLQLTAAEAEAVLRFVGMAGTQPVAIRGVAMPVALLHAALREKVDDIAATLTGFIQELEPKTCAEVIANGVKITGGGVLIPGLAESFAQRIRLPLYHAPHPLESVIHGACLLLGPTVSLDLWDALRLFWPRARPHPKNPPQDPPKYGRSQIEFGNER